MGIICSVICAFLSLYGYIHIGQKKLYSPLFVFSLFWSVLTFLSELRLFELYETSSIAYLCVILGMVGFAVGCHIAHARRNIKESRNQTLSVFKFNFLLIVCLGALVLNFQVISKFLTSGFDVSIVYYTMAANSDGEETEMSSLFNENLLRLQQFVAYPLLYTIVPISIAEYLETKKKYYLWIAIFLSLVRFLFDIRRTYIVILAIFIIIFLMIRRSKLISMKIDLPKFSFKTKFKIFLGLSAITILFTILSSARRSEDDLNGKYSFAENFYFYYVGSLPYFGQRLDQINNSDYTLGLTSFRGFFSPIFAVTKLFGADNPDLMEISTENINSLHNISLLITPSHKSNSYATCFFEFFLDGGYIGVFFFSFLFGCYSQHLFEKAERFKMRRDMWKYAYFASLYIFLSVLHFNGAVVCYLWPFIIESLFYKKNSYKGE